MSSSNPSSDGRVKAINYCDGSPAVIPTAEQQRAIQPARNVGLEDLESVGTITGLTALYVSDNQIENLKPLTRLVNLMGLDLKNNQIRDVRPLGQLKQLKSV